MYNQENFIYFNVATNPTPQASLSSINAAGTPCAEL